MKKYDIKKIIFFDIETRSLEKELTEDSVLYPAWEYINRKNCFKTSEELLENYSSKAPLYAEFSAICCISIGYEAEDGTFKTKSFFGDNEKQIILDFYSDLNKFHNKGFIHTCSHAGKFFDIPFIIRRSLVHGIEPLKFFDVRGLKPWEMVQHLDTKELWACGGTQVSLISLTTALGLPSPKQSLEGSEVNKAYWGGRIDDIVLYCEKGDVPAVYGVFKKIIGTKDFTEFSEDNRSLKEVLIDINNHNELSDFNLDRILKLVKGKKINESNLKALLEGAFYQDNMMSITDSKSDRVEKELIISNILKIC